MARCKKINKYTYAKKAKVTHDHPIHKEFKEDMDELYAQAYSGPRHDHDDKLYHKKMKEYGLNESQFHDK